MNENSFFWHDYETFGRDPRRDRPAQFAGIRTDAGLQEIGEPVMLYCRPSPDYLPDPEACLLTGILPQDCLERGLPEHAFAEAVEAELGRSGTIGVGYNSIRFDDEVSRHLFWRALLDPYAREWRNGCSRWDLLDVVRCTAALRPAGIEWPRHPDGRPSLRLEDLSQANGLGHEQAHDALSDVRATIALARRIRERQPRLWDFCLRLRHKQAVLDEIGTNRPFIHISGMYGSERNGLAIVWPLARHPLNRNEIIVWDLGFDPAELAGMTAGAIRQRLFVRSDELPAGQTRLPIKSLHINKSPIVIGNLRTLTAEVTERLQIDLGQIERHSAQARALPASLEAIWQEVYGQRLASADEAIDPEIDLYGGFISDADRRRLEQWRLSLASEPTPAPPFEDPRLEELSFRYRAKRFPDMLDSDEKQRWHDHCKARLHHGAAGALTLAQYAERIDALSESLPADHQHGQLLLEALYDYAEHIA